MSAPIVCLTMIVRDEEAVIERALHSTVGLIDAMVVVDTGSTDNTLKVMQTFARTTKIPFASKVSRWRNDFSHHRNESLELASSLVGLDGFYFFLDADETVLEAPKSLKRALSNCDVLSGWLSQGDFHHKKHFFVKQRCLPRWHGRLHERLVLSSARARQSTTHELVVAYGDDGVRRRQGRTAVDRDLAELSTSASDLGSAHRRAYLRAMTLESVFDYNTAESEFFVAEQCATHVDEFFLSRWGQARCSHQRQSFSTALNRYEAMIGIQAQRAEGWTGLAQLAFSQKEYEKARTLALRAIACPVPYETTMYDRATYGWLPLEILANVSLVLQRPLSEVLPLVTRALEYSPRNADDMTRLIDLCHSLTNNTV